ncbi:unnamed protein product [Amoebophrya sp. A120]|nr:unnamed protein product [Amoebophrya sp. A120]|eukprot:GSA120T00015953001.1
MAGKEVKLIKAIATQEDFESVIASEKRLIVLDVYHQWYGPCAQMEPTFKSLAANTDIHREVVRALEILRDLICAELRQFYMMDLSVVPAIEEKYLACKAKAKPMFLFYMGGKQVGEVLGCDAPKILGMFCFSGLCHAFVEYTVFFRRGCMTEDEDHEQMLFLCNPNPIAIPPGAIEDNLPPWNPEEE